MVLGNPLSTVPSKDGSLARACDTRSEPLHAPDEPLTREGGARAARSDCSLPLEQPVDHALALLEDASSILRGVKPIDLDEGRLRRLVDRASRWPAEHRERLAVLFGSFADELRFGPAPSGRRVKAVSPKLRPDPEIQPKFLRELQVDRTAMVVWRSGHGPLVDLSRYRLQWHIFIRLYEAGEHGATKDSVLNGYRGETTGFDVQVSSLRQNLLPLGITVKRRGLKLVECDANGNELT